MAQKSDWKSMAMAAKKRMANIREKTEEATEQAVATVITVGAATAMSYARGRLGENGAVKVAGVDVDLGAGLAAHVVAFLGGFGKYHYIGHSLGNGLLACYGTHKGFELGVESKQHASGYAPQMTSGRPNVMASAFDRHATRVAA